MRQSRSNELTTQAESYGFVARGRRRLTGKRGQSQEPGIAQGRAEADADDWWRAARTVFARMAQQTSLSRADAIGVTGQAPTAVPVDAEGRAKAPKNVFGLDR